MRLPLLTTVLVALGLSSAFAATEAPSLAEAYAAARAEAAAVAGKPYDFANRAAAMRAIYADSKDNHRFPLVALHGALWGARFFAATGPIADAIAYRYFYDSRERARRREMLRDFSDAFAATNRAVFIDTYANYAFTKAHGTEPGAEAFVRPELLGALNRVHAAAAGRSTLSEAEKKAIFLTALTYEQELTVGPRVRAAVDAFDCPVMERLALRPLVRFAYFPRAKYFAFRDFSDRAERIRRATAAYDLAVKAGWNRVESSMDDYGVAIPRTRD